MSCSLRGDRNHPGTSPDREDSDGFDQEANLFSRLKNPTGKEISARSRHRRMPARRKYAIAHPH
jgi:predicted amidophosphoribosyltransferase